MKKTILSIISVLMLTGLSFAQDYSINVDGDPASMSGQEYTKNISVDASQLHVVDFQIHNNTITSKDIVVRRSFVQITSGWEDQFCVGDPFDGGYCYSNQSNPFSSGSYDVASGDSIILTVDITAPTGGSATMRYDVLVDGNETPVDFVEVTINSTLSVEEKKAISLNISPNPANNFVNINYDGITPANVKVVDVLGNIVYNEQLSGSKKIDVSSFRNGIYFVTVNGEGTKTVTRKLIVRH